MMTALRNGHADFNTAFGKINGDPLDSKLAEKISTAISEAKLLMGIRAASTVTYLRLPEAKSEKSRGSYIRECKRLVAALGISLPTSVVNALENGGGAVRPRRGSEAVFVFGLRRRACRR